MNRLPPLLILFIILVLIPALNTAADSAPYTHHDQSSNKHQSSLDQTNLQRSQDSTNRHAQHFKMLEDRDTYQRTLAKYTIPDIILVDMHNNKVSLHNELNIDSPVILNFIFTTCTTICPIMSATIEQSRKLLGEDKHAFRMVSISIDPEQDTPETLRNYAAKFHAESSWHFLTGKRNDIITVLNAFKAYRGEKMNHVPITLLRASTNSPWVRLDGLTTAKELVAEYRQLLIN